MKGPSRTWATLRLKKRRKRAALSAIDKVEIRAAINAGRYLTPKYLAKRYRCSVSAIYRIERMLD